MPTVEVALEDRAYPVVIVDGGFERLPSELERLGAPRVLVVTDDRVGPLWSDKLLEVLGTHGIAASVVSFPNGEKHKTVETWSRCIDALLSAGIDRSTPVLALGGGVVGDIAGFAAASALRGVPYVQVPTTVLAMVDSSVGGKTGINHPTGKNLIGAFYQPKLVYTALDTLRTLPPRETRAGLAEAIKTAVIGDPDLLSFLETHADALAACSSRPLLHVVTRCVSIKAQVVASDEREHGVRAYLNAGHTVGHAIEAATGYTQWLHGEAVGMGLIAETTWAVRAGHCTDLSLPDRLRQLLKRLGLPTDPPPLRRDYLLHAMQLDKKANGDILWLPVPVRVGQMRLIALPRDDLQELIADLPCTGSSP